MKQTPFCDLLPAWDPLHRTGSYAGVGSRDTPREIQALMSKAAIRLETLGLLLQTGDAAGADAAFRNFVSRRIVFTAADANDRTRLIAKEIHPAPHRLGRKGLDLMARNTFQVFGRNLDTPVDFVLAWTPDGMEHFSQRTIHSGGTAQAIELASRRGIPVFNMKNADWGTRLKQLLGT